jgi:hypothetical protein
MFSVPKRETVLNNMAMSKTSFRDDIGLEQKFLKVLKSILGNYFFVKILLRTKKVECLCPSKRRKELFSREKREGWSCDGVESEKFNH